MLTWKMITFDDIEKVKLIRHYIPKDHLAPLVDKSYELLGAKMGKMVSNSFIGGLMQLTKKKRFTIFTYNEEYAQACRNLYKSLELRTDCIVELVDQDTQQRVHYVTYQQQIKNYHTGAPIWCQLQEDSNWALHLMTYSVIYKQHNATVSCWNVDAIVVQNANKKSIEEADINVDYKDDFEYIGKFKLEDKVKVKGNPVTHYTEPREAIVLPEIKRNIIKRDDYDECEYNTRFMEDVETLMESMSFLITAHLAGSGKLG